MRLAYFDCFSGISGDMTLGALIHLGVPVQWLAQSIAQLPLEGFALTAGSVRCNGIVATRIGVEIEETHHHRTFEHIQGMIEKSRLSDRVKGASLAVFDRLATAESVVHGCPKASVHFHEVGAIDAIVDIVGVCLGLEYLEVDHILSSPLPLGGGFVTCAHGVLPVPAPAVLEILKGLPVYGGDASLGELVTPTGAALLTGLDAEFKAMPQMRIDRIGYGAGSREIPDRPNLLRVAIGEPLHCAVEAPEQLVLVETCIDDMNPEIFSYLMEMLFEDGALDVYWVPVQMKKNRPGTLVNVLCAPERRMAVVSRILTETTSLGVRYHEVYRNALVRQAVEMPTVFGAVQMKKVSVPNGQALLVPEYEECRRIARERNIPLRQVYDTILRAVALAEPS